MQEKDLGDPKVGWVLSKPSACGCDLFQLHFLEVPCSIPQCLVDSYICQ